MWPDKNGKNMDRQNFLTEDDTKYYWFPYFLYVYIENNTFFPVDESKIWGTVYQLYVRYKVLSSYIL